MVNTRAKMQRTNGRVREWLKANGYKNIYAFPHGRFSKDYHITTAGITADFDGIATHNDSIVFFQSKTNCKATQKTLREYKALETIFGIEVLWFNKPDRKPLEVNNIQAETFLINRIH